MRFLFTGPLLRSIFGIALIAGLVLGLLAMPGCGGKRSSPEKATQAYLNAAKKGDLDAMLDGCAPDLRDMLDEMIKVSGEEKATKQMTGGKLEKFKIVDTEIKDEWADVKVSLTVDGKEQTETFKFHKIEGEWLFDMPKEQKDAMKVGIEMMKDPEKAKKIMELMEKKAP